jgi:hypothetical protein
MVAGTSWLESSKEIAENSLPLTTLQDESLTLSVNLTAPSSGTNSCILLFFFFLCLLSDTDLL